jgi:hypothetical protein
LNTISWFQNVPFEFNLRRYSAREEIRRLAVKCLSQLTAAGAEAI